MKIAIINAKYSANLGDGAIAECLEDQLRKRVPNLNVFSIDRGGSSDYGGSNSMVSSEFKKKLWFVPKFIQRVMKDSLES